MTEAPGLEIRPLTERDVPSAMKLKESAGWNQTEADWLRLLRLEPRGCFAATVGERLVGTVTTTAYGRKLAWVGMVLVDPSLRRRGIASRLMGAALSYLDGERVETVKLDATPDGRHVYERLGFEPELTIERWQRPGDDARPERTRGPAASIFESVRREEVLELDRAAFGADRARLVEALFAESLVTSVTWTIERVVVGYALAREGASADYVGPVVAPDLATADRLLEQLLGRLGSRPVYVDLNTRFDVWAARALFDRGFSKQRDLIRMRRGAKTEAGTSRQVFAIAGPEVG